MLVTEYNRTHHERQLKHWQKETRGDGTMASGDLTPGMDMTSMVIGVEIEDLIDDRIREGKISKIKSEYPHVSHLMRKDISQMNVQRIDRSRPKLPRSEL